MPDPATLLWAAAAFFAVLTALAAWADRRRARRRELDRPGWVPWTGITLAVLLLAVVCAALAVRV